MAKNKVVYKLERYKWPDEIREEKTRNRRFLTFLVGIVVAFMVGGASVFCFIPINGMSYQYQDDNLANFEKIYTIMKDYWYFGKDIENLDEKLIDDAIYGMMQGDVDLHTSFMKMNDANSFMSSMSGSIVGIGVSISSITGDNIVLKVFRDSPAQSVGILPGDKFLEVDGVDVSEMDVSEMVNYTRGEAGTSLNVKVQRGSEVLSFDMLRNVVNTTLFYEDINDQTGYIEITTFSEGVGREVEVVLKEMKSNNIENLVIDLRDNGGGYLSGYTILANLFFPYNSICIKTQNRDGVIVPEYTTNKNPYEFEKIVILTNESTASASEIFAIAMRENLGATIVGTKTYGKGTVQIPQMLGNGDIIKYTNAEWLSPNGVKINKVGIEPDEVVEIASKKAVVDIMIEENLKVEYDSVSEYVLYVQMVLELLEYDVDRVDGYFSKTTEKSLKEFESEHGLSVDGIVDEETISAIVSVVYRLYNEERNVKDIQKQKAIEIAEK